MQIGVSESSAEEKHSWKRRRREKRRAGQRANQDLRGSQSERITNRRRQTRRPAAGEAAQGNLLQKAQLSLDF
jgi:hypothetical protein